MYNDNDQYMKVTDISNKYITNVDNKALMKSKLYSKNQQLLYSSQGEFIVNDKCLTTNMDGDLVYFDDCKKDKNQTWELYNDKITLSEQKNKCLTSDNGNLKVLECKNDNEMQNWNVEQPDVNKSTDYVLPKYKGKIVVLVESDNPWYLNKDITIPLQYSNKYDEFSKKCGNIDYNKDEEYAQYSQNTEHFTQNIESDNTTQTHIILLLLLIVGALIFYKCIIKKN